MTAIVFDFEDIKRRLDRKPVLAVEAGAFRAFEAAVKTLEHLGYSYTEGAELWKPPLGRAPKYFAPDTDPA